MSDYGIGLEMLLISITQGEISFIFGPNPLGQPYLIHHLVLEGVPRVPVPDGHATVLHGRGERRLRRPAVEAGAGGGAGERVSGPREAGGHGRTRRRRSRHGGRR